MVQSLRAFLQTEKEVVGAWAGSRLLVIVLAWFSYQWIPHTSDHGILGLAPWNLLFRWDAVNYHEIATTGYQYTPGAYSSVAFFPFLPLCLWALSTLTQMDAVIIGFLFSNMALLGAAILFRRLVSIDFPPPSRVPERSVWLLLLSPMTFFFSAIYTESLFLLLTVAALLFARKRNWLAAGVVGALATATRPNGILILLPLVCEALQPQTEVRKIDISASTMVRSRWWLVIIPGGILAYGCYLHGRFGDALAYLHSQAVFHRTFVPPWHALILATRYPTPDATLFIGTAVFAIALCIGAIVLKLRGNYQIYVMASVLVYLCSNWYALPRYLSVIFPFYVVLALGCSRSESRYTFFVVASSGLMAICLALFVTGYPMI